MTPPTKIRVVVVDDHDLVRAGIAALLKSEKDIQVVGEASSGRIGVEKAKELKPDIVLMDLSMPEMDGIDATVQIAKQLSNTKVIVLTQHDQAEYIHRMIAAGASGYLLKNSLAMDLLNAIRRVAKGERYFPHSVSQAVMDSMFSPLAPPHHTGDTPLTKRETEILERIAVGKTNNQIAESLHISVRTVEFHRANLLAKLGIKDTAGLVKYAIQKKLITLEAP